MTAGQRAVRVLVVGWPSFRHGEATAGDVLAMEAVRRALAGARIPCDLAWSPVFRPGGRTLEDARPEAYTHLVFTCGPAHGWQVARLHERYRSCRRIAVGVSVIDPADPAVTGFHAVFPRDAPGQPARRDLSAAVPTSPVPVVGIILAGDQPEYAALGRHAQLTGELGDWLGTLDCARVSLDTRLRPGDWRGPATAAQIESAIAATDVVVTTRLHGLVLALKNGVPALAVDPVAGGAKVARQAAAWDWPVLLPRAGDPALGRPVLDRAALDALWAWCRSPEAVTRARSVLAAPSGPPLTADLLGDLRAALAEHG
jgi:Polysaccharide pyruvyl transferase